MFSNLPGTRSMSEPWCMTDLQLLYKTGQLSKPQFEQILKAMMRLLLKPDTKGKIQHMFIKMTPFTTAMVPMLQEQIPTAKFFFATRNMKKTMLVRTH